MEALLRKPHIQTGLELLLSSAPRAAVQRVISFKIAESMLLVALLLWALAIKASYSRRELPTDLSTVEIATDRSTSTESLRYTSEMNWKFRHS
jgi:hypothetical protein